jgi:hypothetical protein
MLSPTLERRVEAAEDVTIVYEFLWSDLESRVLICCLLV